MDKKLPPKNPVIKYKFHIGFVIIFISLLTYIIILGSAPKRLKVNSQDMVVSETSFDKFIEYVEVEGITHPINSIKVNSRIGGNVDKIYVEEGMTVKKGDTIFTLDNPRLLREISDQKSEWEKTVIKFREQSISMEQKSLNLRQQALQTNDELNRLKKSYELDLEEFKMGIKSKAQLEMAQDEFDFKIETMILQKENIYHDSVMTHIRKQLLAQELEKEKLKYNRILESYSDLVVLSPVDGQISFLPASIGQRIGDGESVAEVKIMDKFKIKSSVNEFYVDRFVPSMIGGISYQNRNFPIKVCKVVAEVKNRSFDIEMIFTDSVPENARVGKSFRVRIELDQPEETLIISRGNFYQSTAGQWVYRLSQDGKRAIKTPVTIGRQNPKQYEILSGLKPGDKVIVSGYDKFGDIEELIID